MRPIKTSLCLLLLSAATFSVSAQNVWTGTSTPTTTTGNVGIGNAAPAARLDINTSSVSSLKINHNQLLGGGNPTNIIEIYRKISGLSGSSTLINWLGTNGVFGLNSLSNTVNENRMLYSDNVGNLKSSVIELYSNPYFNNGTVINSIRHVSKLDFVNAYTGDSFGGVDLMSKGNNELWVVGGLDVMFNVKASSFITTSDRRLKDNIQPLKDRSPDLLNINSYSYTFKKKSEGDKKNDTEKLHFGFIAQEVEKEFPNLVSIDEKGNYALNYIEFIPLLLNELKDQKSEIKDLKEKMAALEARINGASETSKAIPEKAISASSFSLEQNVPNPFNRETVIRFNAGGDNVSIGIYDLAGRQLQAIPVKKGEKQISVSASTLTPGTYIYNLQVDGKLIDSKKMIVTN
ncbi:tail fiber domain-containing protein [Chryseobacterium sp. L7]|uniref:Tail fiber domain-containing protein n=1 Tax=Chryseobacterium endalhagicum TaxID=2797638 RepID=A0ABS1QD03_9FLAO|nr:tail fiber domain-containing protein [Chryseobacterium endalhagicum]MBL1220181.1 tail fiber domain-containing protein [Chryseobacterium endalhagicum]